MPMTGTQGAAIPQGVQDSGIQHEPRRLRMASKTVLIDAESTQYPRRPQDAERITTRVNSAHGITTATPRRAPGDRAVRMASLGHDATERLTHWIASYSVVLLRLSLGGVFLWFGLLKFFPNLSPAEALATRTLDTLTLGYLTPQLALRLLALWETAIGLGLLLGVCPCITLALLFLHMGGTLTPLFLFPNDVFAHIPYAPTLEAQYILKNLVFISAGCVIGTSNRTGAGSAVPDRVHPRTSHRPRHERQMAHAGSISDWT
jgi:uncharacterized membrane protein YphA (DoxX/SURF4 family)